MLLQITDKLCSGPFSVIERRKNGKSRGNIKKLFLIPVTVTIFAVSGQDPSEQRYTHCFQYSIVLFFTFALYGKIVLAFYKKK